jgi:drug/metabolite transporter (DMT)-like permease
MLLGAAMALPPLAATGGLPGYLRLSGAGAAALLFLGLACSGIGYLLWSEALAELEPSRVAALLYLQPLVTLAAAAVLLGEPIGLATVVGGGLVIAGVAVVQRA